MKCCQCLAVLGLVFVSSFLSTEGTGWAYKGQHGVDHWATDYPDECDGKKQSPVDIVYSGVRYDSDLKSSPFVFSGYDNTNGVTWKISNNGHSVVVEYTAGSLLLSGGHLPGIFKVLQFHFHWGSKKEQGSEHLINGEAYPMELHIVHYNTKYNVTTALNQPDGLAVLGYFFQVHGAENTQLQKLVPELSKITYSGSSVTMTPFALDSFISGTKDFFRYSGGLTTPACNEVVTWTVFKHPIKLTAGQLSAFRTLLDDKNSTMQDNYRPPQMLHGRVITASFEDDKFLNSASAVVSSIFALAASLLLSVGLRV